MQYVCLLVVHICWHARTAHSLGLAGAGVAVHAQPLTSCSVLCRMVLQAMQVLQAALVEHGATRSTALPCLAKTSAANSRDGPAWRRIPITLAATHSGPLALCTTCRSELNKGQCWRHWPATHAHMLTAKRVHTLVRGVDFACLQTRAAEARRLPSRCCLQAGCTALQDGRATIMYAHPLTRTCMLWLPVGLACPKLQWLVHS